MAIAREQTAVKTNGAATTSLATVWDLGTPPPDGRMMVAVVAAILQTTITAPAGWTLLDTQDAGSNLRAWLYYRWSLSETVAPAWTLGSSAKSWAWVGAYTGVEIGSTPVYAKSSSTTPGTGFTGPGVAVPADGWRIDAISTRHTATGAASTWTFSDALAAELLDFGSNAGSTDIAGAVYDSNRALAAETAARTFTSSQSESIAAMFAVSLAAAAGGGGPPPGGAGARWGVRL